MADEIAIRKPNHSGLILAKQSSSDKSENKKPPSQGNTLVSSSRNSLPVPSVKSRVNNEDIFNSVATNFLTGITTGSPQTLARSISKNLILVSSDTNPNTGFIRNREEIREIQKVQAWVTSGGIKKSYKHCVASDPSFRRWINLNEYPGRIIPSPIKDSLNEEFKKAFPFLDPRLTLSKLVNLRENLIIGVWKNNNFDPVTLASGLTCFDRLLNMNLINKSNRKLYAAVCVLLAFKFIEENHLDETKNKKQILLDQLYHMDNREVLTTRMILEAEFSVYSYLNFSMNLSYEDIKENLTYIKERINQ